MTFTNEYGNSALIETLTFHPYKGARLKTGYRVSVVDSYGFLFHVSVFETMEDAKANLKLLCFDMD